MAPSFAIAISRSHCRVSLPQPLLVHHPPLPSVAGDWHAARARQSLRRGSDRSLAAPSRCPETPWPAPRRRSRDAAPAGPWRPRADPGRLQVAVLQQLAGTEAGPVRDDAAAGHRAAEHEGDGARAVVGSLGAVDPSGAAELGHHQDRGLPPRRPQTILQSCQPGVEFRSSTRVSRGTCATCVSQPPISSAAMRGPSGARSISPAARASAGKA